MKKTLTVIFLAITFIFSLSSCSAGGSPKTGETLENFYKSGSGDMNYVELSKINDNLWVHTSYSNYKGSRTPSNGMIAVTSEGLILIDTTWNDSQMEELVSLTKGIFKKNIIMAVITHAHEDRIGGINTLLKIGVEVKSTAMTAELAEKQGFHRPGSTIEPNTGTIQTGNMRMEMFYPGEGHTADNITVWFPDYKVLFGGCLIKSEESNDIGINSDSNAKEWPVSVKKILDRYPEAQTVVPGHGKWGNMQLIMHTLDLLKK